MLNQDSHPAKELLEEFLIGKISESVAEQIENHLNTCQECLERLNQTPAKSDHLIEKICRVSNESQTAARSMVSLHDEPLANQNSDTQGNLGQVDSTASHTDVLKLGEKSQEDRQPAPRSLPSIRGYEILQVIGEGGMGIVFKARHLGLNRVVAIKMIRNQASITPEDRVRFHQEAQTIAKLQHPNIVQIFEFQSGGATPYFVLEFLEAGSLDKQIRGKPIATSRAVRLVADLAKAMHFAHSHGVIHRDLKPANILLAGNGLLANDFDTSRIELRDALGLNSATTNREAETQPVGTSHDRTVVTGNTVFIPKITDFGLAKNTVEDFKLTQTGMIAGTPSYMAPEQILAKFGEIGPRTDVYALGCILYECLVGRAPFLAASSMVIVQQVIEHDPVPPRKFHSHIPKDLETICLKCLEKDPNKRYATAADLATDLELFDAGKPIRAKRRSVGEIAFRWCRGNPGYSAAIFSAIVILLSLLVGAGIIQQYRVRQFAEATIRRQMIESELAKVVTDAQEKRSKIRRNLTDPVLARPFMNAPQVWQSKLGQIGNMVESAKKLAGVEGIQVSTNVGLVHLEDLLADDVENYKLAQELQRIRLNDLMLSDGSLQSQKTKSAYEKVFGKIGIDLAKDPTNQTSKILSDSDIRYEWIDALDHLAEITSLQSEECSKYLQIARAIDPDEWRNRLRSVDTLKDRKILQDLATDSHAVGQPAQALLLFARKFSDVGGNPLPLLRQAIVDNPNDFWLNFALGVFETDPKIQTGFFRAALALRPDDSIAEFNLAVALANAGDKQSSTIHYERIIARNPEFGDAYINLASLYDDLRQFEKARKLLTKAAVMQKDSPKIYVNLGMAYYRLGQWQQAIEFTEKALSIDKNFVPALINLGSFLAERGDAQKALWYLRNAEKLSSKSPLIYFNLGKVLQQQGQFQQAIENFQQGGNLARGTSLAKLPYQQWIVRCQRFMEFRKNSRGPSVSLKDLSRGIKVQTENGKPSRDVQPDTMNWYRVAISVEISTAGDFAFSLDSDDLLVFRLESENFSPIIQTNMVQKEVPSFLLYHAHRPGVVLAVLLSRKPMDATNMLLKVRRLSAPERKYSWNGKLKRLEGTATNQAKHSFVCDKGKFYEMSLQSHSFDTVLEVFDASGTKLLARNDDYFPSGSTDSQLLFLPPSDGTYQLLISSYRHGDGGDYRLEVSQFDAADDGK